MLYVVLFRLISFRFVSTCSVWVELTHSKHHLFDKLLLNSVKSFCYCWLFVFNDILYRNSENSASGGGPIPSPSPNISQHRKSNSLDAGSKTKTTIVPSERFRCIVPYPPNTEYELELQVNDIIYVHKKRDDGWYKGTLQRTGRTGLFPASFVETFWFHFIRFDFIKVSSLLSIIIDSSSLMHDIYLFIYGTIIGSPLGIHQPRMVVVCSQHIRKNK